MMLLEDKRAYTLMLIRTDQQQTSAHVYYELAGTSTHIQTVHREGKTKAILA